MSDPVTNIEIEDVLSSIRRLVSGEAGKPARRSALNTEAGRAGRVEPDAAPAQEDTAQEDTAQEDTAQADTAQEDGAGGPIAATADLPPQSNDETPAHAAHEAPDLEPEEMSVAAGESGEGFDWANHLPPERLAQVQHIHEPAAAPEDMVHDVADSGAAPEVDAAPQPERLMLTPALRVDNLAEAEAEAEAEDHVAQGDAMPLEDQAALAEVFREDEPFVFDGDHKLTDYASDALETDDALAGGARSEEEDALDAAWTQDGTAVASADDDTAMAEDDAVASEDSPIDPVLKARVAALAAAVAGRGGEFEPDEGDESLTAQNASLQWEDHISEQEADFSGAEAEASDVASDTNVESFVAATGGTEAEMTDDDSGAAYEPAAPVTASDDEGFLDEDALREMVSEIVRQELQGALGERITRNVRKLVRREIQRALTSQTLE